MRVPLVAGFYTARSLIANAQRCVNLYPEINNEDAEAPVTHNLTPGLRLLSSPGASGPGRGLYVASNGQCFAVIGAKLYSIGTDWVFSLIGTVNSGATPVSMADNGAAGELVLVDGTADGWTVDLPTGTFTQIVDDAFYGADRVDFLDTFLVFNRPGTRQWYSSLSGQVTPFDPTYVASKSATPDNLSTLCVTHREVWLLGSQRGTEIWYDAGAADFPFEIIPGSMIEYGIVAKYSLTKYSTEVYWIGQNAFGQAVAYMGLNYKAERISTFAIEQEWSKYSTVSDAVAFMYQQQGHVFYFINFPTANKTWVYDRTVDKWHERTWTDSDGQENRHRAQCAVLFNGKTIVLDWENGNLYELALDVCTDFSGPIVRRRGYPHFTDDGNRVAYNTFIVNIDCGNIEGHLIDDAPVVNLLVSDDRGHTFWAAPSQSLGSTGQYIVQAQFQRLGMGRDRVFEIYWSSPAFTAVQGAWVDAVPSTS